MIKRFIITISVGMLFLTSCGKSDGLISKLENCLGSVKTKEDAQKLSKDEAVEIAQCMLPYLKEFKEELSKLDREEARKKEKDFMEKIKKSPYSEVLKSLNYKKVKRLAEQKTVSSNGKSPRKSENWDKLLDNYERYVEKSVKFLKKANNGDMEALEEYSNLLEEAEKLQKSLEKAKNEKTLNQAQLRRMVKIQNKMLQNMN